jgi:hypothetical protein
MLRFRHSILLAMVAVGGLSCSLSNVFAQTNGPERSRIPAGPWRIAGTVVNAKGGGPLARTRVTIMDAKNRQNTQFIITADDGRFEFHVPAGKFALQGSKRGFITAAYNQHDQFSTAIVTGAGIATEDLTLRLSPNAVLTGRVIDEFGEPVRNAQVMVYRENRFSGISRISRWRGASTDDQGRYEITPLDEGTYFVSAKATPWFAMHPISAREGTPNAPVQVDANLDVAYPITYYGDTAEADQATPIPVRGGDHLEADIHLNPVPALHLLFHMGEEGGPVAFPQLQRPSFDGVEDVETSGVQNVSPGVYEMTGIAAGRYMVRMPDSSGQLKEPTAANLTSNQELDGSSGNSTSKVKVRVEMAGEAAIPQQVEIWLRNSKGKVTGSEVDAKGEANFTDVIPDKYDVLAGSQNETYSVARIAWDRGETSGRNLDIPPGSSLSVSLTLTGGSATVDGFAKRNGKGVAGAMVVLIPKNPEANRDRFRRDQTDLDGSFTLFNVSPGPYTVIAIEDGWDLDWAKPAVLGRYGRHGQPLMVGAHEKGTVHLSVPVEVESK